MEPDGLSSPVIAERGRCDGPEIEGPAAMLPSMDAKPPVAGSDAEQRPVEAKPPVPETPPDGRPPIPVSMRRTEVPRTLPQELQAIIRAATQALGYEFARWLDDNPDAVERFVTRYRCALLFVVGVFIGFMLRGSSRRREQDRR